MAAVNDVLVGGALEIDSTLFADGGIDMGTVTLSNPTVTGGETVRLQGATGPTTFLQFGSGIILRSPSDNRLTLRNAAGTHEASLQINTNNGMLQSVQGMNVVTGVYGYSSSNFALTDNIWTIQNGGLYLTQDAHVEWRTGTNLTAAAGLRVRMNGAGIFQINNGTSNTAGVLEVHELAADPAAPAANGARLYVKDNGAGATQLCVLFDAGTPQCFVTQVEEM